MKKLLIAFTLIMSSFFFCNCVNAATYEYTITETDIDYVTSEEFKIVRENAIEYSKENDMHYRISYSKSEKQYAILYYEKNDFTLKHISSYGTHLYPRVKRYYTYYKNGVFSNIMQLSATYEYFYGYDEIQYLNYLDTNIPNLVFDFPSGNNISFKIYYNEQIYEYNHGSTFKSLYEIYIDSIKPDYSVITNFYTVVIEKISLFSNLFIQNTIYLFVFVILILIFLIELIRRYLL